MIVLDPGHAYRLDDLKSDSTTDFRFYKDEKLHGNGHTGPSTQEVQRMIIDRVKFLDSEQPWRGNQQIIEHGRAIIALFEARALEQKVHKGLEVELMPVGKDGHLVFDSSLRDSNA